MLSVKDQIVESTATELKMEESLVDFVVMWANKDAREALRKYKSVEVSGFGKFIISSYRVTKRIELMDKTINTIQDEDNFKKLQSAIDTKAYYKTKL